VAVPLPEEIRGALRDRLSDLRLPGRVSPPENWHITLRFLGEIGVVAYERFLGALSLCDLGKSFKVRLVGMGTFPNSRRATVAWVGIDDGSSRLEELAGLAEESAQAAGLDPEERPFRPHLTVSRIRPPQDLRRLLDAVEIDLSWRCDRVVVYSSHHRNGHPLYEALETFEIAR